MRQTPPDISKEEAPGKPPEMFLVPAHRAVLFPRGYAVVLRRILSPHGRAAMKINFSEVFGKQAKGMFASFIIIGSKRIATGKNL